MLEMNEDGSIELTRGDSAYFSITIRKKIGENQYENYEIQEGDVLRLSVKNNTKESECLIQKTYENGQFHFLPSDTANLNYGKYKYDVEITLANGDVFTVVRPKKFTLTEEVTF